MREVPIELRDSLSLAAGLCAPSPEARQAARSRLTTIQNISGQQAFDLLVLLTSLVKSVEYANSRISGPGVDQEELLRSVAAASELLLGWPTSLMRITTAAVRLSSTQRATLMQRISTLRDEDAVRTLPADVTAALFAALRLQQLPSPQAISRAALHVQAAGHDRIVGVRPAAEAAGTSRDTMEVAWRDGLVTQL